MLVFIGNNKPIDIKSEHINMFLNSLRLEEGTIVKIQSEILLDLQANKVDLEKHIPKICKKQLGNKLGKN